MGGGVGLQDSACGAFASFVDIEVAGLGESLNREGTTERLYGGGNGEKRSCLCAKHQRAMEMVVCLIILNF